MNLKEMKEFVEELKTRKEMLNAVTALNSINEGGIRGEPSAVKSDQLDRLLKEIHELIDQLKAVKSK